MKKLLVLFALFCLAGNAGKTVPQIALDSCTPGATAQCDSNQLLSLLLTGLNPHKLYIVSATDGVTSFTPGGVLDPTSNTLTLDTQVDPGAATWTFTVLEVNHNGTPHGTFGSTDITFN